MAQKRLANPETDDLEKYFTDVEYLRNLFANFVMAEKLPKRILAIHGVGGVGKSSLMRMFRLYAKSVHIPIALTSAEESKSAVDVLSNWSEGLKSDGVVLSNFQKTLVHYKAIQAKVEDEAKKAQEARKKTVEKIGAAVAKAAVSTVINLIPGAPIVTALVGVGADALMDWLGGFLTKPDIDLLVDPSKALSKDFLEDIAKVARKRRLVLIIDTFEQMSTLNDWVCDAAKKLDGNVLLVITGREMVNWDRQWDGWLAHVQVEELHPMTENHMRALARRYYATMVGGDPDPKQIDAIINFARGLPMVVATAVRLWVKYRQEFDIKEQQAEVYSDVVKRLQEGVPSEILPILEATAVLRWFDKQILREVMGNKDIDLAYEEIRRFPFVKSTRDGLRLHDSVRDIFDENLRIDDRERHHKLHARAAKYFDKLVNKLKDENELQSALLERLYHLVKCGNEDLAITESQVAIDRALAFYRRPFAESVVDLLTVFLQGSSYRQWIVYYKFRIATFDPNIPAQVAQSKELEKIISGSGVDSRLRALINVSLSEAPKEAGVSSGRKISLITEAISSNSLTPNELANSFRRLADFYWEDRSWSKAIKQYDLVAKAYRKNLGGLGEIKLFGARAYAYLLMGEWNKCIESAEAAVALARNFGGNVLASELKGFGWGLTYIGNLEKALAVIQESLRLVEETQDESNKIRITRRLAEIYDRQARWSLSNPIYLDLISRDEKYNRVISRASLLALLGVSYRKQGLYDQAEELLLESLPNIEVAVEPIALNGLAEVYLATGNIAKAKEYFELNISKNKERPYYFARATLGVCKADLVGSNKEIEKRLKQAEEICASRAYNDILANIALVKGQLAQEKSNSKTNRWLHHIQIALIYALRYNRFLLDEILNGKPQGTLMQPIIPYLLNNGETGKKMLVVLHDWWKSGNNKIRVQKQDTVSPIPKGIALLEAEKLARELELGDGNTQITVLDQLIAAIEKFNSSRSIPDVDKIN